MDLSLEESKNQSESAQDPQDQTLMSLNCVSLQNAVNFANQEFNDAQGLLELALDQRESI